MVATAGGKRVSGVPVKGRCLGKERPLGQQDMGAMEGDGECLWAHGWKWVSEGLPDGGEECGGWQAGRWVLGASGLCGP